MDLINHPSAPGGRFTDGDPGTGTPGTVVTAGHMNAVQDEILTAIEDSGQSPDASNFGQLSEAISRLSVSNGGLTNRVLNGTFAVWQRGDSFAAGLDPEYTADRWEVQSDGVGGAGRGNVTRQFRAAQAGVLPGVFDHLRYTPTVPADQGGPTIRTKIEAITQTSDRRMTFSMVAKASDAIQAVVQVRQIGSGSNVGVTTQTIDITTSFVRHQFSFDMPALSNGLGAGGNDHVEVSVRLPNLTSAIFDLARAQLEEGAVATTFEERALELERLLCQRYFQTSYGGATPGSPAPGYQALLASGLTPDVFRSVRFFPWMRNVPTVTLYTPGGTAGQISWDGFRTVNGMSSTSNVSLGIPFFPGGRPTVLTQALFHWTADAEI